MAQLNRTISLGDLIANAFDRAERLTPNEELRSALASEAVVAALTRWRRGDLVAVLSGADDVAARQARRERRSAPVSLRAA